MSDRGSHRPIHERLLDDPRFLALETLARALWFALKLRLGPSGIDVVYPGQLEAWTGGDREGIERGLRSLSDASWVVYEEIVPRGPRLVWLINGLKHEPTFTPNNDNHRKSIERHLTDLPKSSLVKDFCDYYGIEVPDRHQGDREPLRRGSEGDREPLPKQENRERRTENGEPRTERPNALEHTPREEADVDAVDNSSENGRGQKRGVPPEVLENPWHREHDDRGTKVIEALEHLVRGKKLEEYALEVARARPGPWRTRIYEVASDILADARSGEVNHAISRASMVKAIKNK